MAEIATSVHYNPIGKFPHKKITTATKVNLKAGTPVILPNGVKISSKDGKPQVDFNGTTFYLPCRYYVYTTDNSNILMCAPGTTCVLMEINGVNIKLFSTNFPRETINYVQDEIVTNELDEGTVRAIKTMYDNPHRSADDKPIHNKDNRIYYNRLIENDAQSHRFAFTQFLDKTGFLHCSINGDKIVLNCYQFDANGEYRTFTEEYVKGSKYITWIDSMRDFTIQSVNPSDYGVSGRDVKYPGTTFDMRQAARKLVHEKFHLHLIFDTHGAVSNTTVIANECESAPRKYTKKLNFASKSKYRINKRAAKPDSSDSASSSD